MKTPYFVRCRMKIEQLLARRTDLSTFIVHLTRDFNGTSAKEALAGILREGRIEARSPFGHALAELTRRQLSTDTQRCVCFTETPLEHVSLLLGPIEGRRCEFQPYGLAITKKQARAAGVNPVWYVDITPGHDWLSVSINKLVEDAAASGVFDGSPIARLAPFIEQMGTGFGERGEYRKEFWWEREWRGVGSYVLPLKVILFCPESDFPEFSALASEAEQRVRLIDPAWSLEQMIGRLAEFPPDSVGPF